MENKNTPYRVLARKYRPRHFDELRGQDALVRTLKNAITSGRLAQAYMLTGVRGVGKTTTARIIARAINYVGPDGTGGPTTGPTDDCPIAQAIEQDRCSDVIEIDAASHNSVEGIRTLTDGVRYAPTMARYKVYIIDEVHMLSTAAFNALLKTLEEPPPHVKFIFATTEIRKVPMTILSRCQRFDLRRLDEGELKSHLSDICIHENVTADDLALTMIARAAGGSVRDALSMLDQAIALGHGTSVEAEVTSQMLGLIDQSRVADVLTYALTGQIPTALGIIADLNKLGSDMAVMIEDLLALVHRLIKSRVMGQDMDLPFTKDQASLREHTLPTLSRAWQILLRSLTDVQNAPDPFAAAEMAIIRLGYASTLPDPSKLMRTLEEGGPAGVSPEKMPSGPEGHGAPSGIKAIHTGNSSSALLSLPILAQTTSLSTIQDIVAVIEQSGNMILATSVSHYIAPIKIETGHIECMPLAGAPPKITGDLGAALSTLTGIRWVVTIGKETPGPTAAALSHMEKEKRRADLMATPLVSAVILAFPGAVLEE